MISKNRDIIDEIVRTLGVALLVYLTTYVLLVGISSFGASLHPLLAILLGLSVVYVGLSVYYYRNPHQIER